MLKGTLTPSSQNVKSRDAVALPCLLTCRECSALTPRQRVDRHLSEISKMGSVLTPPRDLETVKHHLKPPKIGAGRVYGAALLL
jgi:hypothetical protein